MRAYFGGGLNEQIAPHLHEAAAGSYNFDLSKDTYQLRPRRPFDLADTLPNGGQVNGIMQLVTRAGNESTLVHGNGQVYRWYGSATFSVAGSCATVSQLRDTYWSLDDYLVITDLQKSTVVKKWDGTTFGTQTTGLGSDLYAKYALVHLGRVWLFNVKTTTDTPHLMVASAFENPTSYSTAIRAGSSSASTGNEAFYMLTPDLRPINGACLFHGNLVISTEGGAIYKLTGSDARDFKWVDFFAGSQVVGDEGMVNMGNDVAYMRKGGNIERLLAVENSGDVSTDDLSRWIPDTVRDLASAIAVYDQTNQKVLFFVTDKILVFFKDIFYGGAVAPNDDNRANRAALSPWSVYRTQYADAALSSIKAAKYMRRPGTSEYTVYFGDASGRLLDVNGEGDGDIGSVDIVTQRKTRFLDERDGIDFQAHILRGEIEYRRTTECSISLTFEYGDSYRTSDVSITLKGPPSGSGVGYFGGAAYFGGAFYFSQAFSFSDNVSHQRFSPAGRGSGATLTVSSETGVRYLIDSVKLT